MRVGVFRCNVNICSLCVLIGEGGGGGGEKFVSPGPEPALGGSVFRCWFFLHDQTSRSGQNSYWWSFIAWRIKGLRAFHLAVKTFFSVILFYGRHEFVDFCYDVWSTGCTVYGRSEGLNFRHCCEVWQCIIATRNCAGNFHCKWPNSVSFITSQSRNYLHVMEPFTTASHLFLSWATRILFTLYHPISLRCILILSDTHSLNPRFYNSYSVSVCPGVRMTVKVLQLYNYKNGHTLEDTNLINALSDFADG
jgi:hypothetical protein